MGLETIHSTGWLISEDDIRLLLCQSWNRLSEETVHVPSMVIIPISNMVKKDFISSF